MKGKCFNFCTEANSRQGKVWRVNPLLWEVICSTLLTNPAEQCVVQHVIGEIFIQESLCLHREALALLDILTIAAGTGESRCDRVWSPPPVKDGKRMQLLPPVDVHQSLIEKAPPVRASTPTHHSHNHTKRDGLQRGLQSSLEDAQNHHRMQVLRSHLKTPDAKDCRSDANAHRPNKAKKVDDTIHGICRSKDFKKGDLNGDSMHKLIASKKKDACLPRQRSISSSSTSSSSDKMRNPAKNSALCKAPDQHADDSSSAAQPSDFSALLHDCGHKINAYDIDEVVHELHEAFAAEQVYLNHLVEQLRRALDECIDSHSMVRNKPKIEFSKEVKEINCSKEVKDHVKNVDAPETLKNELPREVKAPRFGTKGQIGQKPLSSKAAYLSKPGSLPTLKSIQREKADLERNSALLSKVPCKIDKPTSKHVLATRNANKLAASPVNERRKPMSVLFPTHLSS